MTDLKTITNGLRHHIDRTCAGCPEGTPKDDTEHMAYEIYGTIRHALYLAYGGDPNGWSVAAQEPLSESGRPMPKCEVTNDG